MKVEPNDKYIRPAGKPDHCFYCGQKVGEEHHPRCELLEIDCHSDEMESPHGRIQWKGTNVCMDVYCSCGYHGHIDDEFFYYYKCCKCNQVYSVGSNVKLTPIPDHLLNQLGMEPLQDEYPGEL